MGFDGFGLGGSFSKKYGDDSLQSALAMLKELPETMPVYGLGIGEPSDIFASIASMHNVKFILDLVSGARQAILDGRFNAYRNKFIKNFYGNI